MTFEIYKLSKNLGAEVKGLDLQGTLSPSIRTKVNDAFVENNILVFRNQNLNAKQFLAAAKQLGQPTIQKLSQYKVPDCPMGHCRASWNHPEIHSMFENDFQSQSRQDP